MAVIVNYFQPRYVIKHIHVHNRCLFEWYATLYTVLLYITHDIIWKDRDQTHVWRDNNFAKFLVIS